MRLSNRFTLFTSLLLAFVSIIAPLTSAGSVRSSIHPVDTDEAQALRDQLKLAGMRQQRWERVIDTQKMLMLQPNRLSLAVSDAAKDLNESGRELVFEGVTGGLSSVLKLQAYYVRDDIRIEKRLKEGAAGVEFAYKLFVKERVGAAQKEDPRPEDVLDKVNATLGLVVEEIPNSKVRSMVEATMALSRGTTGFLSAYLRDEPAKVDRTFGNVQSLLGGTLAMLNGLSKTEDSAELSGRAAAIAREIPEFKPVAEFMATTALTDFNLSLAIANIGWGLYGMRAGQELDTEAAAIRLQQQKAAIILQRLLPRAKREVLQAMAEQARLRVELQTLEASQPPDLAVLPSQRFIDDGVAVPVRQIDLPFTLDVIHELPGLTSGITEAEKRRREQAARAAERQERRERERAAREEEQRRRREADEAQREARRQRSYAEERDNSYRPSRETSAPSNEEAKPATAPSQPVSDDSNSCWKRHCLGGDMNGAANKIIDELNKQQKGSTLGQIPRVP